MLTRFLEQIHSSWKSLQYACICVPGSSVPYLIFFCFRRMTGLEVPHEVGCLTKAVPYAAMHYSTGAVVG